MFNLKNKKGFTLVELLAVIVVLAIVMGLAAVAITNVLENTRKSAFVADAKSFLEGAHNLVNADDMNTMLGSGTDSYAPSCNQNGNVKYIPIGDIRLERGGEKSPYGNLYLKSAAGTKGVDDYKNIKTADNAQASYVKVTSVVANGNCSYTYEIFLSDGVYAIRGTTAGSSLGESSIANDKVLTALAS